MKKLTGRESLKINWVVSFDTNVKRVVKKTAYKVVAISDKNAFCVPFKEFKNIEFKNNLDRRRAYQGKTIPVAINEVCNVHGVHLDNLDKAFEQKQTDTAKRIAHVEEIRNLNLSSDLENILLNAVKKFEEELNVTLMERFEKALADLKNKGQLYGAEWKEMTMGEIARAKLNGFGKEGWRFAFEINGKFYFERARILKEK